MKNLFQRSNPDRNKSSQPPADNAPILDHFIYFIDQLLVPVLQQGAGLSNPTIEQSLEEYKDQHKLGDDFDMLSLTGHVLRLITVERPAYLEKHKHKVEMPNMNYYLDLFDILLELDPPSTDDLAEPDPTQAEAASVGDTSPQSP